MRTRANVTVKESLRIKSVCDINFRYPNIIIFDDMFDLLEVDSVLHQTAKNIDCKRSVR